MSSHGPAGALRGALSFRSGSRLLAAALLVALAGCETGPEVVQNGVTQCIEHMKLPGGRDPAPFCRCLGQELESRFDYATIRQYRLKTDNWTYFLDVADDQKFMAVQRVCVARHVPQ